MTLAQGGGFYVYEYIPWQRTARYAIVHVMIYENMTKIILLTGLLAIAAAAQPQNIIRVVRNGNTGSYYQAQNNDPKAVVTVLGMSATAGLGENWLIEFHDSFGDLEVLENALGPISASISGGPPQADELLPSSKALIAIYRPGLSYRADQGVQSFPRTRYFDIAIYRIRLGTEADFGKFLKLRGFGQDSINLDKPEIAYQVVSGAPAGTYIVLTPLPSLRVMDDARATTPAYAQADIDTARKIAADLQLVREHLWFRVDPRLSFVSDQFAADDSTFWRP
jgi:hypothetical protein